MSDKKLETGALREFLDINTSGYAIVKVDGKFIHDVQEEFREFVKESAETIEAFIGDALNEDGKQIEYYQILLDRIKLKLGDVIRYGVTGEWSKEIMINEIEDVVNLVANPKPEEYIRIDS